MQNPPPQDQADLLQLLTLTLAGEKLAIDILQIREVVRRPGITRLPTATGARAGIVSLRGTLIEVYDLATLALGKPVDPQREVLLVCDVGERTRGFLVDEVHSILRARSTDIQTSSCSMCFDGPLLRGFLLEEHGRVLSVLDLAGPALPSPRQADHEEMAIPELARLAPPAVIDLHP